MDVSAYRWTPSQYQYIVPGCQGQGLSSKMEGGHASRGAGAREEEVMWEAEKSLGPPPLEQYHRHLPLPLPEISDSGTKSNNLEIIDQPDFIVNLLGMSLTRIKHHLILRSGIAFYFQIK